MYLVKLKSNLLNLMKHADINAARLARATAVPKSTISDWLNGNKPKNIEQVKKVSEHFKITIDSLCFGDDPHIKKEQSLNEDLLKFGRFDVYLKKVDKQ